MSMILGLLSLKSGAAGREDGGSTTTATEPAGGSVSVSVAAAAPAQSSASEESAKSEAAESTAAKACPQCGSTQPWGISSWCPNCFYHPRLGQSLSAPPPDPEVRHLAEGYAAKPDSYATMLKAIPPWAHVLWLGLVGVLGLSVFQALKLPKVGYERAVWTLLQAGLGLLAAGIAHVSAFFNAVPVTDKYGPFDIFLKPFEFWGYSFRKLPKGAWRLWLFAWGLSAALAALVLIGGIRYSSVFETKSAKDKNGKKSTWYQTSQIAPQERAIRIVTG
jgi:hypothetical protein